MNNRVPIPTDNIYKFYALFGLALFITGSYALQSIHNSYLEVIYETYQEQILLSKIEQPTNEQSTRLEVLEHKRKTNAHNKVDYTKVAGLVIALGMTLMFIGFAVWQLKIQPLQDDLRKKEIEKINLEIDLLKRELETSN